MIKSFVLGLLIGGTSGLMAMHYHLVRTPERLLLVSRVHQPPLRSIYVDARNWNPARWQQYPELSEAMIKAGHQELLARDIPRESQAPVLPAGIQHPAQQERFQQFNAIPQINHRASPYQHPPTAQITTEVAAAEVMPLAIVTPIPDGVGATATKLIPRTISKKTPAVQVAKPVSEVLPERESTVMEAVESSAAPVEKQNWMKSLFDSILPIKDSAANLTIPENVKHLLRQVETESLIASKREEQRILAANKPIEVKVAPVQSAPTAVAAAEKNATVEKAAVSKAPVIAAVTTPKEATPTAAPEQRIKAKPAEMAQPAPAAIVAANPAQSNTAPTNPIKAKSVEAVAAKPVEVIAANPVAAVAAQANDVSKIVANVMPEPKPAEPTPAEVKAPVAAIASTPPAAVAPQVATTIPEAPPACKPTFTVVPMSSPLRELTPTLARPIADPLATEGFPGQPTVIADAESSFPVSPRLIRSQVK